MLWSEGVSDNLQRGDFTSLIRDYFHLMIRFILILKFLFFEFFNLSNFILIFYDVLNLSQDTLKRIKLLLLLLLRQIHLLSHMHQDIKLFRLRVQKLGVLFSLIIIIILHQIEN